MSPGDYDAWYASPRGRWIGETEYELARRLLGPGPGESLLDVGCGTGWFARRFAEDGLAVTGLDPKPDWLAYARRQAPGIHWVEGDARRLPFPDASFDLVASIAALCFIDDERRALAEVVRVTRRRFAVGWLNRASLLYRQKGRDGGSGAYRGARWHGHGQVRELFEGLPVRNLVTRSTVFLPGGGVFARGVESVLPKRLPFGALTIAAGDVDRG